LEHEIEKLVSIRIRLESNNVRN